MNRTQWCLSDWKSAVIPGLYFLTVEPELAVYGKILRLQKEGYIWAVCYHDNCSEGEESKLHRNEITVPLSAWQFQIAKQLGWPSYDEGLSRILNLPPD